MLTIYPLNNLIEETIPNKFRCRNFQLTIESWNPHANSHYEIYWMTFKITLYLSFYEQRRQIYSSRSLQAMRQWQTCIGKYNGNIQWIEPVGFVRHVTCYWDNANFTTQTRASRVLFVTCRLLKRNIHRSRFNYVVWHVKIQVYRYCVGLGWMKMLSI